MCNTFPCFHSHETSDEGMFGNLVCNKNRNVYLGKIIMSKTPKREGNTLSQLTKTARGVRVPSEAPRYFIGLGIINQSIYHNKGVKTCRQ